VRHPHARPFPEGNAYAERWVRTVRTEILDRTSSFLGPTLTGSFPDLLADPNGGQGSEPRSTHPPCPTAP
jgi:hypothetical protein